MAVQLRKAGSKAAITAAVNSLQPSQHTGQADQLSRVQSIVAAELASFPNAASLQVVVHSHHDDNSSTITVIVQPARVTGSGELAG